MRFYNFAKILFDTIKYHTVDALIRHNDCLRMMRKIIKIDITGEYI